MVLPNLSQFGAYGLEVNPVVSIERFFACLVFPKRILIGANRGCSDGDYSNPVIIITGFVKIDVVVLQKSLPKKFLGIFFKSKPYRFQKGDIILRADDIPSGIYYIEKGFVKVYALAENADENLHIIYKEGELFPLIWAFSGVSKDVFYEAMGDVTLRRVPKKEFLRSACDDPEILLEILNIILAVFSVHIDRIENLGISNAYPRVIARLLTLARRFGEIKGKSVVIRAPITHGDIATSINMTRETASREIERLEEKGLVKKAGRLMAIMNIAKLRRELEKYYERELL